MFLTEKLLSEDLAEQTVGVSPTIHHKEDVADVDTNATGELRVEEDVAGEAVPIAVEGEADEAVASVEHGRAAIAASDVVGGKEAELHFDEVLEQETFWTDKDQYYSGIISFYARLKLIEEFEDDILSLHHLHEHGYQGDPRSVREIKDGDLLDFLLHPHQLINDDVYDVDYPEDDEKLYEGALMKVNVNKYERNQKARRECVAKKGYQCLVCGRDFEATYGEIGKNFIHVHHLTPISSIGEEYELNVDTDLAPVCPNCHYMLHRKNPPYTIEELKDILAKQNVETKPKRRKKADSIWLQSNANMLRDVNADADVRRLIHNMMEMDGGTMMKNITSVCVGLFTERYRGMKPNDWRHLIDDYVRRVTQRPDMEEDERFFYKAV